MTRTNWVKIKQYTINGKHKRTYSSIKKATQVTGINGSQIIACAKAKRKRAGEFVWRYEGDEYILIN